ncbi:Diguanylate cyclase, predicted domain protein, partial [Candidatus Omnitrophus magneticus]
MYLDLDNFKNINDNHGHDAGDLVLKKTANRLMRCLRETDTIARLGGDEFALLSRGFGTMEELKGLCCRIIKELGKHIEHKGKTFSIATSIGISLYPDDGSDPTMLLKKADTAMYNAKKSAGSKFIFYDNSMDKNLNERDKLEDDIR